MSRETKFGYGFLFVGAGMPYLIDKLLGPTYAIDTAILFTFVGIYLLFLAHAGETSKRAPWIVGLGMALVTCSLFWYVHSLYDQLKPSEIPAVIFGYGPAVHNGGVIRDVSEMTALVVGTSYAGKYEKKNRIMLICRAENDQIDLNTDPLIDKSRIFLIPEIQTRINVPLSEATQEMLKKSLRMNFYLAMVPEKVKPEDIKVINDVIGKGGRFLDAKVLGLQPMRIQ